MPFLLNMELDLLIFAVTMTLLAAFLLHQIYSSLFEEAATAKRDILLRHMFIARTHSREVDSLRYCRFWFREKIPYDVDTFMQ